MTGNVGMSTDTWYDQGLIYMVGFLGLVNAANGLFMFFAPQTWFFTTPGVVDTGPFNHHLVQDVGTAYFMTAIAAFWALRVPAYRFPLMAVASVFIGLHGVIHVVDIIEGRCGDPTDDVLAVILPALLWIAVTARLGQIGPTSSKM